MWRPRLNGSGPTRRPLPPPDKDGVVGGDAVLFNGQKYNLTTSCYLIENVARKRGLEGAGLRRQVSCQVDGRNNRHDVLDQCRALSPNFKWMISCLIVQLEGMGSPPFLASARGVPSTSRWTATRPTVHVFSAKLLASLCGLCCLRAAVIMGLWGTPWARWAWRVRKLPAASDTFK